MILHRLYDWLRPKQIVDSLPLVNRGVYVKVLTRSISDGSIIVVDPADERAYVYARRWRWSR